MFYFCVFVFLCFCVFVFLCFCVFVLCCCVVVLVKQTIIATFSALFTSRLQEESKEEWNLFLKSLRSSETEKEALELLHQNHWFSLSSPLFTTYSQTNFVPPTGGILITPIEKDIPHFILPHGMVSLPSFSLFSALAPVLKLSRGHYQPPYMRQPTSRG